MSCPKPTGDEEAILKMIEEGARLAEEHDVKGLMKLTTSDFSVQPGGLDETETKRILLWAFMRYGQFKVLHPRSEIDLDTQVANEARVRVPFLIVKKDQSLPNVKDLYQDPKGWLQEVGEHADLYRLELELSKQDGDWLVRGAHLEGFTGLGFSD
jgi:hypothetical protein